MSIGSKVRHLHWIDGENGPCVGHIVKMYGGDVLVEWETLPPKVLRPKRMLLTIAVLRLV